ncbi:NAD-dependent epimerase/dehydratase family protein [Desulfovibrio sp. OttesenSCG-928-A18]|nr:NAD-dependent epimerase/dehydratase family protein [Desulfovibrio sp. OttesenSCG-928-A18]
MGRYLVTGVGGFVGSAVALALLRRGDAVIGVDNLSTGFRSNIPEGVLFVEADCTDSRLYTELLPKEPYDAILHIAGQGNNEISVEDPAYTLRCNTESTLALVRFALEVQSPRFIYASSMAVYGDPGTDATFAPVTEESPTCPPSFYGVSKLAAEHYLRLYEKRGLKPTILRLFSVYGPGQNMDNMRQGMVSIFMAMMEQEGHIHVRGNPSRFRDFIYIDDVVRAFVACLDSPTSCGRTINISGTGRVQVGDLVEMLRALRGTPVTVEYSGCTADDVFGLHADASTAARWLGYESEVPLKEGLEKMYAWYMKRRNTGERAE